MKPSTRPWRIFIVLVLFFAWFSLAADYASESQKRQLYKRLDDDPALQQLYKKSSPSDELSGSVAEKKQDRGTRDAPVDGKDGKPHAGPFVEPLDSDEPLKHAMSKSMRKEKSSNDDGVMSDRNRETPKKGTTGTDGGVTEKSKSKEAHEKVTGRKQIQRPESPKDSDAVSHKEEDLDSDSQQSTKLGDKFSAKPAENDETAKGALSVEKPEGLSDQPHKYPLSGSPSDHDDELALDKPTTTHSGEALQIKEESDSDEEDGVHDLIRWDSLFGSFTSITATEIGDKTFIVAALMAMRHPRIQVFTAAFAALFVMTILSGITGHAVGAIISKKWSALLAAALFLAFGAKSLREGAAMDPNQGASEEIREVQAELEEKELDMARANGHTRVSSLSPAVLESGRIERSRSRSRMTPLKRSPSTSPSPSRSRPTITSGVAGIKNLLTLLLSPAWVETFSMTFVGELGDRSQIATVAMAAGQEYYWIMVGATLGHCVCTAGAVLGGSALAGRISMRTVTLGGGFIFIGFGIFTLYEAIQYFR
ncbi:MAG: hypothetical protein Q9162_003171 [Coniocarpon cinnabarinum]